MKSDSSPISSEKEFKESGYTYENWFREDNQSSG